MQLKLIHSTVQQREPLSWRFLAVAMVKNRVLRYFLLAKLHGNLEDYLRHLSIAMRSDCRLHHLAMRNAARSTAKPVCPNCSEEIT